MVENMQKGFTLVETLVAITILILVAVGPMGILANSIGDLDVQKNRLMAINLARDITGIVEHKIAQTKNTCGSGSLETDLSGCASTLPNSPLFCDIDYTLNTMPSCPPNGCQLYVGPNNFITHTSSGGTPLIFSRSVSVIQSDTGAGSSIGPNPFKWSQAQVKVHVTWTENSALKTLDTVSYFYNNPSCYNFY